ncbi:hypothetical protein M404DRAFT_26866 [Pisolithus tinctorius Marx 270]|uniref:Uncharacterized protein n=1 Tax=Pisolithus tinctorius Marx 270 TaxID=870435 RepID=A0A0C3P7D8_PISTI|nr:hypothetical protein M404DRAFT_26866 [Pisolithus tinctorius Marx 270]
MPASRPTLKRCFCEECVEKGGTDSHGKARGVLMEARFMPAHMKRVHEEHATQYSPPVQQSAIDAIDSVAEHLFALTITDDGPDPGHGSKQQHDKQPAQGNPFR